MKEPQEVILARIDENIKFLKYGAESFAKQLDDHQKQDDDKFRENDKRLQGINKNIWTATGGLSVLIFIIQIYFNYHK